MPFFLQLAMNEYIAAAISAAWWDPANKKAFLPRLCKAFHNLSYA